MEVSYRELCSLVKQGSAIRWCGITDGDLVHVQLLKDQKQRFVTVDADKTLRLWKHCGVIRNGEAMNPLTDVDFSPSKSDSFATLRKATVLGINISGDCTTGCGKPYNTIEGCVCGYDIELDMRGEERGGFPLPSVPILSVALWCSCGFRKFISTMELDVSYCIRVDSQPSLVSAFIHTVAEHQPLWLVGWNCYSFDNTCMLYQADNECSASFLKVKIGSAKTIDYGYIINIPGVFNVDPFGYMQRSPMHSAKYTDFSLHGIALKVGSSLKTEMPDLYTVQSPKEILDYNMNDSAIAAEIWVKAGLINEIPSLAVCSCSHVYDCIRHMTSVTARCPLTSEALALEMKIDWSECSKMQRYAGGKVLEPIRGLHSEVAVCDYSSMYPTIMIDANISPETLTIMRSHGKDYGSIWWDSNFIYVELEQWTARFPRVSNSIQRRILEKITLLRVQNKKSNPVYAGALKIVANSMYGAMGYEHSPMYSPSCSSSVTAIGRWCLNFACKVFEEYGMKIVYGDTDSCFAAPTVVTAAEYKRNTALHAEHCISELHSRFQSTPFMSMRMSLEAIHMRVLLIEKKKYCTADRSGDISYKGVSVARRDTLGICKTACQTVSRALLLSPSLAEANFRIAGFINSVVLASINNRLQHSDVSRVVKRDQKRCYVYIDKNNDERVIPVDMSSNIVADFSITHVLSSLRREILRFTVPCGIGSVADIVERSELFV